MEKTFFSDFFNVSRTIMKEYGAFDISLISDTPAFIDPFLLYSSKIEGYQKAHRDIIEYIKFLCKKAEEAKTNPNVLEEYYYFKEPKQNWLGYVQYGSCGYGLKNKFAEELCTNASSYINNFGHETITNSSHMEKLCLFSDGHGLDNVSDFTTCLIMPFLLDYTEKFSKKYLDDKYCKKQLVRRAYFDYKTEEWKDKEYYLPVFENDYVILVPEDILVKGENYISRKNFIEDLKYSRIVIEDIKFREHINEYIAEIIHNEFTNFELNEKINSLIRKYPQLIDYYIKSKENNSNQAIEDNKNLIREFDIIFNQNCNELIKLLKENTKFYDLEDINETSAILKRLSYLKCIIEKFDGNKCLYIDNRRIDTKLLTILFNRVWFAGRPKEGNNRYIDYTLEFKTAFNSPIGNVLANRYVNNNKKDKVRILCYIYFNDREHSMLTQKINDYGLSRNEKIIIIDAGKNSH
ncbi:hypothetical protein N072000002_08050 [Clostridium tetani]|uniref:Uncharacterized protein n=1 Tax=Clostridium tetani TaxID=1513 RepID=A0ABC8EAC8_CLOTA|nr:hypothetical protein [Clostridium tetani]BDR75130.1 hypothetical protein K154306013_07900 [Clostridium tetani]BDR80548.1 hypothetical protein K234311028_07940 [Clostridium tetani]BDR89004.1 hypothetical protein N072000002_08050 [Clostridium tetani]